MSMFNCSFSALLNSVLEPTRDVTILFGLLSGRHLDEVVACESYLNGSVTYTLARIELSNHYAWLDILFIDEEPAGSVVSVEIAPGLYHMVGMQVTSNFRGRAFLKERLNNHDDLTELNSIPTPAFFLLSNTIKYLEKTGRKMTLEVMNFNNSAHRLYEKKVLLDNQSVTVGFNLLPKQAVVKYAKLRRKKIGKWHAINETGEPERLGVQWRHIPDYNGQSTWSISRIYLWGSCAEFLSLYQGRFLSLVRHQVRMLHTIVVYGSPFKYVYWKASKLLGNKD